MAHPDILPMDLLTLPSETAKVNFRWGIKSGITKNSVKKTVRESVAEILSDEPRNLLHCGCFRARSDEGKTNIRSEEFIGSNRVEKVFSCFVVAGEVFFGTFLLPEQKKVQ